MKIDIESSSKVRVYNYLVEKTDIYAPCGGKGMCGKCKVKVLEGEFNKITEREELLLSEEDIKKGIRLACYLYIDGKGSIEIENKTEDMIITNYMNYFRDEEYIAICDIGTTTIEIEIYNSNKNIVAEIKFLNPQRKYGSDIIARAEYGAKSVENIEKLRNLIIEKLNKINYIKGCKEIYLAGNSVMQQILAGITTGNFLEPPYNPAFYNILTLNREEINIKMRENGIIKIIGNIGGFVGGDSLAIIEYFARNKNSEDTFLIIDLGTNGEIILFNKESVYVASTAAGPAFEAVSMECGMTASEGSIIGVELENCIKLDVIGGKEPKGICGSGYISIISELLYTQTIDKNGNISERNLLFPEINKNIFAGKVNITQYIYISQKDIRAIQTAKSAIATTVEILIEESKIREEKIEKVILSGNFGGKLTDENVKKCKILPNELFKKIYFESNLVLKGLKSMFIDDKEKVKKYNIQHINTAEKDKFEKKFIKNMNF
jgi:uncharacterized 2Fe-2S/4Fe-4S cluster protein (DUF4445 family)